MNDELLIQRYLDGRISAAELALLHQRLREDAALRGLLREIAEQATAFGDMARIRGETEVFARPSPESGRSIPFSRLALAASLAVLAASAWLFLSSIPALRTSVQSTANAPDIVEVEEVAGWLSWTGPNGQVRNGLTQGTRLAAGNFQAGDETSTAVLRFADGTRLTLGSGGDVLLSDDGQKRVHLKSGALGADVRPQPPGKPLLIHTPTATLEVLGTVFSVTAAPEQTTMSVQEGRVRFERLSDGQKVEVSANHDATATLDSSVPFLAKRSAMPPAVWRANFEQPPSAGSRGDWSSASPGAPARMKSVPLLVGRHDQARTIEYGVSIRDHKRPHQGMFVSVAPDSVLHLRYRVAQPATLLFFCITQRPGGAFGGNFELTLPSEAGTQGVDGWRTLEFLLSEMRPIQPERALQPAGNGISHFSVRTANRDAALEVTEMSITPRTP